MTLDGSMVAPKGYLMAEKKENLLEELMGILRGILLAEEWDNSTVESMADWLVDTKVDKMAEVMAVKTEVLTV